MQISRIILAFTMLLASFGQAAAQETVFEIPVLNEGLAPPRGEIDLSTPQTAMEAFVFAAEDEDYVTAAHVLNLNDIPVTQQPEVGANLARQLSVVMDRKVLLSWQQLLERPDALLANAADSNPMAATPRKSLLIGVLDLEGRGVAIRLNRVLPKGGQAQWVFSRQTVSRIEPLFERYGPSAFERALPKWMRTDAFGGLKWWEIIGLPLLLILTVTLTGALWRVLGRFANTADGTWISGFLRALRAPLTIVLISALIGVATGSLFVVSGPVATILEPLVALGYVAAGVILVVNLIDAAFDRIVKVDIETLSAPEHAARRNLAGIVSAARRVVVVLAVIVGTGILLSTAKVFEALGLSLLAAAGSFTLVIGFAAREVLGNIIASLQISLNRAARVGDQVIYEDKLATVEAVHFTFVQLRVWDDTRLIVPVAKFISDAFVNRNLEAGGMIRTVTLTLGTAVDLEALHGAFESFLSNDDRVKADESEAVMTGQTEHGLIMRYGVPVQNPLDGWDVECAMRAHLVEAVKQQEKEGGRPILPQMGVATAPAADEDGAGEES
ncbi:mechanosensitive ion channel domain-containing protein [uncultured Sulfitobacter sp.]|uniref:mechanosensitive ion channel family protein n=1 Tax=uncultured Sulfitobacter sp. TaxID=191468 RepID=UPI00261B57DA|nr:mechanosensitive ion channel domain-containing protein [uncultured Sulfitobacter sp.]